MVKSIINLDRKTVYFDPKSSVQIIYYNKLYYNKVFIRRVPFFDNEYWTLDERQKQNTPPFSHCLDKQCYQFCLPFLFVLCMAKYSIRSPNKWHWPHPLLSPNNIRQLRSNYTFPKQHLQSLKNTPLLDTFRDSLSTMVISAVCESDMCQEEFQKRYRNLFLLFLMVPI